MAVDVGHHESYSRPLGILRDSARRLEGLPVLWVGVRCPIEVIWERRAETWGQALGAVDEARRDAVERWQLAVHDHGGYDMEVDTSTSPPARCAQAILARLDQGPPGSAFWRSASP